MQSYIVRLLVGAIISLGSTACEKEEPEVVQRVRAIKTITVSEPGSGQERRFPGVVEATNTSALSFEVSGNTREIAVNVGDRVKKGQVLATLDKTPFDLNVKGAEAEVGRAKAQLAEKTTVYDRQKTLYQKQWVAKMALDQATAARDSAKNQLSFTISKLNLAKRDLEKTVLIAPFNGVIAVKFSEPFEEIARGQKIFELYSEGAMEVVIQVPETSIGSINLGLPAKIAFPAENMKILSGRVSEVGSVASDANAFPVKVAVISTSPAVLPGMTADVSLLLGDERTPASFLIPVSALVPGDEARVGYVFVYDDETSTVIKKLVRGQNGVVRDNRVAIIEGIGPGDIIAIAGVSFLRDGQKVKLMAQ